MEEKNRFQTQFAYIYEMTLSLARPGAAFSDEDRLALEDSVAAYNDKSIYMANPKRIQLLEVGDSHINLKLFSTQALTTPGRGLRTLTALLLKDASSCFKSRVTPGGQLFRVVSVRQPDGEGASPQPASISDADFLKALIDYALERKDGSAAAQKKKAAMGEMKRLALEAGILPL